jgi:predicted N-formylglutamate amidohydrolase
MNANPPIVLNPEGRVPGLIAVDHAGRTIPDELADLGLDREWHATHHFCDVGVAELAFALAERIDVPIVMCDVSRLVIDVNRWLDDPRSILRELEGVPIGANVAISALGRAARQEAIFWPYQTRIDELWARLTARHEKPFFLALHSCTRVFAGARRPWDCGTIWHDDATLSRHVLACLDSEGGLVLGDNQPYSGLDGVFTVDRHTYGSGLPACGLEVSNDLLETAIAQEIWADRLSRVLLAAIHDGVAA